MPCRQRSGARRVEPKVDAVHASDLDWNQKESTMNFAASAARAAVFALAALLAVASSAQTLRIGLAEDPDVLDPTLARTFVGRVVFAALCDKLFDIDEK